MTTTSATTGYNSVQDWYAATKSSSSSSTTTAAEDQQSRFLKMLTTQLKNQDPTSPMDSAQMTSQLAQISTVTELEKLNTTLASMKTSNQTGDTLQAANLVGHSVLVDGSGLTLSKSMAVGGFELEKPASDVTVSILNSDGKEVQTLSLGAQEAGVNEFVWDGTASDGTTLADGNYTVKVSAKDKDGSVTATALQFATVNGVVTLDGELKIDVGSLGRVSMSDIKLIV